MHKTANVLEEAAQDLAVQGQGNPTHDGLLRTDTYLTQSKNQQIRKLI